MKELTMEDVQKIKHWLSKQKPLGNCCILLPDTVEEPNDDEKRKYWGNVLQELKDLRGE